MAKQKLPTIESILGPNPREINLLLVRFGGYLRVFVDTHCIKDDGSPLRKEIFRDRDPAEVQAFVGTLDWSKLEGDIF